MKSLVAIGLLLILLYQLVGLPMAILTLHTSFDSASLDVDTDEYKVVKLPISLPYANAWDNPDGQDGLVRDGDEFYNVVHQQYANDTLYTLLKTNQNARARFFDLADQFQQLSSEDTPAKSPLSRLLKLFQDRLTTYLLPSVWHLAPPVSSLLIAGMVYARPLLNYGGADLSTTSPPPEA